MPRTKAQYLTCIALLFAVGCLCVVLRSPDLRLGSTSAIASVSVASPSVSWWTTSPREGLALQEVWQHSWWLKQNCSSRLDTRRTLLYSQLPSVWRNCSKGIYLDIGSNVGVQIRKLYDPQQFPGAPIIPLYDAVYGSNRSGVCALGVEANPVHTRYLKSLNSYFQKHGYQALVLTETAASVRPGTAKLHQDHGSPVELGASLSAGGWQTKSKWRTNEATVQLLDLPQFLRNVIRPLIWHLQQQAGQPPPVSMKMDVEGEEYSLLPGLMLSGVLCDLDMIYMEAHADKMRRPGSVNLSIEAMDGFFNNMRQVLPWCKVNYLHLDDETFLAGREIPLPP